MPDPPREIVLGVGDEASPPDEKHNFGGTPGA
jgi:hypothetical protein